MSPEVYLTIWTALWLALLVGTAVLAAMTAFCWWLIHQVY